GFPGLLVAARAALLLAALRENGRGPQRDPVAFEEELDSPVADRAYLVQLVAAAVHDRHHPVQRPPRPHHPPPVPGARGAARPSGAGGGGGGGGGRGRARPAPGSGGPRTGCRGRPPPPRRPRAAGTDAVPPPGGRAPGRPPFPGSSTPPGSPA